MEISNYRNQAASRAVLICIVAFSVSSYLWMASQRRLPLSNDMIAIYTLLGVLALILYFGLRVSLRYYSDQGALQWSHRLLGQQISSKVVAHDQILATGLRYWRTKEVHYQPVLALKTGQLLPVGHTFTAWSITGGADLDTYREAKWQADAVAKALGVVSLAKSADSSLAVVDGRAENVPNKREFEAKLNAFFVMIGLALCVFMLLFGPYLAR